MWGDVEGRLIVGRRGGTMEARGRDARECALLPTFLSHVDCGRTPERKMEHKGVTIYRETQQKSHRCDVKTRSQQSED